MGAATSAEAWQGSELHLGTLTIAASGLFGLYFWWRLIALMYE